MWFESQHCAMMGVQQGSTAAVNGKRKLDSVVSVSSVGEATPAKSGRWEAQDCIARLQAVAVPSDAWRIPTPTATPTGASALAFTADEFDDDDDDEFEDDLSDGDERGPRPPEPARYHHPHSPSSQPPNGPAPTYPRFHPPDYWQYYQPPQQQTIRCEENGKSYLELGAAPPARTRCCDGRARWCHIPCYRQKRVAVMNLSMCKLARYRQCSDPSLRRSVLICNTLRRLEREMEEEPELEPTYPPPLAETATTTTTTATPTATATTTCEPTAYENTLREVACASGRATPFPQAAPPDHDSGYGEDDSRPINWGSVLSLPSQSDLEPLNNNELYAELGLSDAASMNWKDPPIGRGEEWDGLVHVLVGGS